MSTSAAIAAVVVVAIGTYLSRGAPLLFLADRTLPTEVERALRNVAPAVLSALVVTLVAGGEGVDGIEIAEVAALVVGGAACYATRKLPVGLVAGMVVLWLVIWLG